MTSMKNKYGILCILLIILFFGGMTQNSQIADAKKITTSSRQKNPPANYSTRYKGWASCKPSYMTIYNGKYATMSYWDVKKTITVEYFNSKFKSTFSKRFKIEDQYFGGFYCDGTYFYTVTGNDNLKESNTKTCYRVTKYSGSWKKLKVLDIKNCNTYVPFSHGSCTINAFGEKLYIKTCRTIYAIKGVHHQTNAVFVIDTNTMQILEQYTGIQNSKYGYVSHSWNQLSVMDNDQFVTVDQGDASPRGIVLSTPYDENRTTIFDFSTGAHDKKSYVYQQTGAAICDVDVSAQKYFVTGASVNQKKAEHDASLLRKLWQKGNLMLLVTDKATKKTEVKWLTHSKNGGDWTLPYIDKISENRFVVRWSNYGNGKSYYRVMDADGNFVGKMHTVKDPENLLSMESSVVKNGKLYTYCRVFDKNKMNFYILSLGEK